MIDGLLFALTLFAALGCRLIAGVFFAFSSFVMKALSRLPAKGLPPCSPSTSSSSIRGFLAPFSETAAACVLAAISALLRWREPAAVCLLAGGALYLVGTFLVTIVFNVSKSKSLASVARGDPDGASLWAGYVAGWTAWNHVRTAASLAAATLFSVALGC